MGGNSTRSKFIFAERVKKTMSINKIDDIKNKADKNLLSSILRRNKLASGAKRINLDESLIYTLGVDRADGHLNGVFCLNTENQDKLINEAIDFFKEQNRDFVVWVKDHTDSKLENILKSKGYSAVREPGIAGMMIESKIEEKEATSGYTLKRVESVKRVSDYAKVIKNAFYKDEKILDAMFSNVNSLMNDETNAFILYKDDEPIAAASTLYAEGIAGIYYLGTVESHRGHGIGSFMTMVATNAGFDMGANTVILQASQVAEPIYKKLGYKVITHYRWYKIEV